MSLPQWQWHPHNLSMVIVFAEWGKAGLTVMGNWCYVEILLENRVVLVSFCQWARLHKSIKCHVESWCSQLMILQNQANKVPVLGICLFPQLHWPISEIENTKYEVRHLFWVSRRGHAFASEWSHISLCPILNWQLWGTVVVMFWGLRTHERSVCCAMSY